MPAEPTRAVFLSYAREDTEAARRIAEALRGFGIDVWFDQNELRGGDAWDQRIRTQIKECALFIPIISRNTQARGEAYFRLEWNLAEERTQQIAKLVPFIVPVAVDETAEAGALVPDAFLRAQWTRLPNGVPTPAFVGRVQSLLGPQGKPTRTDNSSASAGLSGARVLRSGSAVAWKTGALLAALMLMAAVAWWRLSPRPANVPAAGVPVVLLMDSTYPDRVYDPVTRESGGSNADDITNIIRDLPVRIVKEATSAQWNRETEVLQENPALIVMHRSAFFTFPAAREDELYPIMENKLIAFMGYVATLNPRTKFIIYSRHSWEDALFAAKWRTDVANRYPALTGRVETWRVPLDRATFRNPITAQEMKDSVQKALGLANARP